MKEHERVKARERERERESEEMLREREDLKNGVRMYLGVTTINIFSYFCTNSCQLILIAHLINSHVVVDLSLQTAFVRNWLTLKSTNFQLKIISKPNCRRNKTLL
jgi:hypothetical protein